TTLLQTDTCYNATVQPNCSSMAITLPISEIKEYKILPNAQQSLNDSFVNGAGLPSEIDEYDFGASPHGTLLRKSLVTYANLGNIGAMPASLTVQDGSGNQKS